MTNDFLIIVAMLIGWGLDLCLGDPLWLPHPVVGFGKMIAWGEHRLNKGPHRKAKGAMLSIGLIVMTFLATAGLLYVSTLIHVWVSVVMNIIVVFYCLAGTTLIREVRDVFLALDRSLDDGRRQVARIVGRDTSELTAKEVRTAALETLAENLSDGVIAPLFWFSVFCFTGEHSLYLAAPMMLTYKMVNTQDSMIGYRTERYRDFGCVAAHIDDLANYIPARLTALLMIIGYRLMRLAGMCKIPHDAASPQARGLVAFVARNGSRHASPNSGYPEAALAGILNCRFGGPHSYFGQIFDKPYIGENERTLTTADMLLSVRINRSAEVLMVVAITLLSISFYLLTA